MKVTVLGSGDVGKVLALGFLDRGYEVIVGTRNPHKKELLEWMSEHGGVEVLDYKSAAKEGEMVVMAVMGVVVPDVVEAVGKESFAGKLVMDVTNPLDFSGGMPPRLYKGWGMSGGEKLQKLLPDARIVKTLNIIGNPMMIDPKFVEGEPDMLMVGNDEEAKGVVGEVLESFGWKKVTDLGGIEQAGLMESLCLLWVRYATIHDNWKIGFSMLSK